LNPLSIIYGGIVRTRNALYDRGLLNARRLQGAVVSVGNVSAGGTGKTPFVLLLGEMLKAQGIAFDVLSRGYGRRSRGVLLVDPAGLPQQFGDEPLLIARKLQVPVIVGEDRYEAGRFSESRFGARLHLLDDGFQHRGLGRDFDIVLVTQKDLSDRLLPAGRLREPLSALRRADAIVLTSGTEPGMLPIDGKEVWRVRRGIVPKDVPQRPVVFCGIARPENFMLQLRAANVEAAAHAFYRDHHAYSESDIQELQKLKQSSEAGGFVTTEKDAINLGPYLSALEPLCVVPVQMKLADPVHALQSILRKIHERNHAA
jgi:tetraacyldisaccharide 4'-kinase